MNGRKARAMRRGELPVEAKVEKNLGATPKGKAIHRKAKKLKAQGQRLQEELEQYQQTFKAIMDQGHDDEKTLTICYMALQQYPLAKQELLSNGGMNIWGQGNERTLSFMNPESCRVVHGDKNPLTKTTQELEILMMNFISESFTNQPQVEDDET